MQFSSLMERRLNLLSVPREEFVQLINSVPKFIPTKRCAQPNGIYTHTYNRCQ